MPYNIIVIAREVWDSRDLVSDAVTADGKLAEASLTRRFEPEDLNSLEQALQIRDREGGKVTVLSLGKSRDVDVLRECLYRGVDDVARVVVDGDLDTAAQATLLAAAIKRVGDHDLVLAGVGIPDTENSMLAPELAARLGHDQVSFVDSIQELSSSDALCKREIEMGSEFIRVPLPAVLALGVYLLKDDPRTPRSAKAMLKLKKKKVPIPEWTPEELGLDAGSLCRIRLASSAIIPPRDVESQDVDPENEAALKAMLQAIQ
jgi:electron transfer flavoprotein beta subunit